MARKPWNNPFAKLKSHPAGAAPSEQAKAPEPPPPAPPPRPEPTTDGDLWSEATAGVKPIADEHGTVAPPMPTPAPEEFYHPDLDALRELEALVSGEAPFDLADSDEFIEGRVTGLDPAIVRRLRRGDYAVQGHVDLHGMTRDEAKVAVDQYLRKARESGKRCVLVVHGRGIHSKDQVPVLKDALKVWLATGRFARHVLAFATARPADGGAGAIYVLLRRAGR